MISPNTNLRSSEQVQTILCNHLSPSSLAFTELFYTERAHVRLMKVLENLFYQPLIRDAILPSADTKNIFSNLEEIVQLHSKSPLTSQTSKSLEHI